MGKNIKQYEKAALLFQIVGWITFVIGVLSIKKSLSNDGYQMFSVVFSTIGLVFIILGKNIKKRKLWAMKLGRLLGLLILPIFPVGTVVAISIFKYLGKDWDKKVKPRIT